MSLEIKIFFALQFKGAHMTKIEKESALIEAIKEVENEIKRELPMCKIRWQECRLDSGQQIGEQIINLIKASDIFIADISEYNPNVLFELGIARGLQSLSSKKTIWLSHEAVDLSQMPSDIRGLYIDQYNEDNLKPLFARRVLESSQEIIKEKTAIDRLRRLRDFWNLPHDGDIDIVCSEIPKKEQPYFADPNDRNYLRYAKFADLDSLIYVRTRITQLFPTITIRDFSPSEYYETHIKGLIVIGGPPWNSKFREFQSQLPFHFIPRPLGEDDPLVIDLQQMNGYMFKPTWKERKILIKDISLFARIRIAKDTPVFLLGGCLTFGVLGAAKCFLDENFALTNVEYIEKLVHKKDFILVCEAPRVGHFIKTVDFTVNKPLVVLAREMNENFNVIVNNAEDYKHGEE